MSDEEELLAAADGALSRLGHGEAEILVIAETDELTRFAGNEIHQSVAERSRHVRVRLVDGGRTGVGEVRGHHDDAIVRALAAAEETRRVANEFGRLAAARS